MNQQLGNPVGFCQPALYQLIGTPSFHQIVKGNNGAYDAGLNWNACTGLGTPNGAAILKALQGTTASEATASSSAA
jgi:kumamolisin